MKIMHHQSFPKLNQGDFLLTFKQTLLIRISDENMLFFRGTFCGFFFKSQNDSFRANFQIMFALRTNDETLP